MSDDVLADPDAAAGAPETVATDPDVVVLHESGDTKLPDHATVLDDGSVELPLLYPVTLKFRAQGGAVREERFETLTMRRLTGKDMRLVQSTREESVACTAIACSARISQAKMSAVYDLMDAADANAASQVVSHFLGTGRRTGR